MQRERDCLERDVHVKSLLTRNPKNKSFRVVVGDDKVSIKDLQVDVFTSAFTTTPRTPDVAKASYVASRLAPENVKISEAADR